MMKRNWLAVSKLTRRFWRILPRALESLKNLHFNCLLLTRVYNVWAKKVRRSCVITLKNDEKFVEELACHFKIDIRNFYEFWLESLKNLHFNGLLLTKVYNLWAKKVQRSYVWWHWILIQNLKEKWLLLSKMAGGIEQIFTWACSEV